MEISAGEFKARCLALMDEVQAKRKEIVITKRGKPVAKLVPCDSTPPSLFGYMRGTIKIVGDIVSPIDVKWNAQKQHAAPRHSCLDLAGER